MSDLGAFFATRGHEQYSGEAVTQLEHALQSGTLAEEAGAEPTLVAAAFLHDLGHLLVDLGPTPTLRQIDDAHELRAARALVPILPPAVVEPIRLHVAAKRFLAAREPGYEPRLSPDSVRSLALQGGRFSDEEAETFLREPHARAALALRRFDEAAKAAGRKTPPIEHFLALVASLAKGPAAPALGA